MRALKKREITTCGGKEGGRLVRSFMVDNVKHDAASASYENGVLKVVLPKENKSPVRKKRIDIQ